jgi:hypothetical protein
MTRKRPQSANRFRDARRDRDKLARKQRGGQLLFPGWFDSAAPAAIDSNRSEASGSAAMGGRGEA